MSCLVEVESWLQCNLRMSIPVAQAWAMVSGVRYLLVLICPLFCNRNVSMYKCINHISILLVCVLIENHVAMCCDWDRCCLEL